MGRPARSKSSPRPGITRCAIYTRKSHEEGLEQDFNSLDAQREACEAYILSQKHEGWTCLPEMYDDGGISGATLERPALKRLLADIEAARVDTVVVYKVDRLTRSLGDFAKIVDVFDHQGVTFVSVTQQFNTTTSMGRLTLNMLLSFAQFEREVTGERIRDKIAASKRKGMWMGGLPPLGYDVQDRKLVINDTESDTVRHIYRRYIDLGSVRTLQTELNQSDIKSKRRLNRHGRPTGGQPLARGALYHLLQNRTYRGEIVHKETAYPGRHEAIVDQALWDAVQRRLAANRCDQRNGRTARQPSLLTGLLVDDKGEGLTPSHAVKKGRRYRYYVSRHLLTGGRQTGRRGWRLPAADLETLIITHLRGWLCDPAALTATLEDNPRDITTLAVLISKAKSLADRWPQLKPGDTKAYLNAMVRQVTIMSDAITFEMDGDRATAAILKGPDAASAGPAGNPVTLTIPAVLKRTGIGMTLIVPGARRDAKPDPSLIRLFLRAFAIRDRLDQDPNLTLCRIAEAEDVVPSYATRLLRLSYLAPDIVTAIVRGHQPPGLTANKLMGDTRLPCEWPAQRALLGFPSA